MEICCMVSTCRGVYKMRMVAQFKYIVVELVFMQRLVNQDDGAVAAHPVAGF
jgi:hypothetical protein